MSLQKIPKGPLREGYTTGTCATAAAKGAFMALMHGRVPGEVPVLLPIGQTVPIPIHEWEPGVEQAWCSVIKDAGDDPDVTHGAEIGCEVIITPQKGITFLKGQGVGTVTLPGLALAVGEPAINPVPRRMIANALNKLLHDHQKHHGLAVKVFVPNGEAIAKKTLNERVGIFGGISILGTTGIVKPYSSSSYIASIEQAVDVAVANGIDELVLNSGGRSEGYLRKLFPNYSNQSFIHYGNWIGEGLLKINSTAIRQVHIGIMLGKAAKLAEGRTDTHSCVSSWNKAFIKELALAAGYPAQKAHQILGLNMAGRLTELFPFQSGEPMYQTLLAHCYQACKKILKNAELGLYLVGSEGKTIQYQKL